MARNLLITAASTVAAAVVLSACGSTVTVNSTATGTPTTTSTTTSQTPTETTTSETPTETTTSETPTETTTTTSEAPASPTTTPNPSTSVDSIHKAAFLKVVKQRFPTITDDAALADGQWVCGEMGQNKNILTVIGDLKQKHPEWSTTNAGYFLGVSIGALCPQYTSKVTAGA